MADPKGILGGLAGKAEKAMTSGRKKREKDIEEEATKLAPDTMPEQWDGGNLMRSDGTFAEGSHVSPEGRGRNGY